MRDPSGISSPREPVRVAASVPVLVMVLDDGDHRERKVDGGEDLGAHRRMGAHFLELALGQPRRLVKNVGGDRNLSHVVEHRSVAEPLIGLLVHVERPREAERQDLGPLDMGVRVVLEVGMKLHGVDAESEGLEGLAVHLRQLLVLLLVETVCVVRDDPERKREDEGPRPHQLVKEVDDGGAAGGGDEVDGNEREILPPQLQEAGLAPERLGDVDPEGVHEKVGQPQEEHRKDDLRGGDGLGGLDREKDRAVGQGVKGAQREVEERSQAAPDQPHTEVLLRLPLHREPVARRCGRSRRPRSPAPGRRS